MSADNPLYIGIHPYTAGLLTHVDLRDYNYEDQPQYVRIRDQRLYHPTLNQLLLVTEWDFKRTVRRYQLDVRPEWRDRVILTGDGTPTPTKMNFAELGRFIRETYPAPEYIFWGAELLEIGEAPIWGCVKYACDSLFLPNKRIDRDACWRRPITTGILKATLQARDLAPWDVVKALVSQKPPNIMDSMPLLSRIK